MAILYNYDNTKCSITHYQLLCKSNYFSENSKYRKFLMFGT